MNALAVVVIAQNEAANIVPCLRSVIGWSPEVYVVDSHSIDDTVHLAEEAGASVVQHEFVNWAAQRNWALSNLPLQATWVLFLDADERLSEGLGIEISEALRFVSQGVAGFYVNRKFVFFNRWLRHGGLWPNYVLRLVRRERTQVQQIGAWEYFHVDAATRKLQGYLIHEDRRGLTHWISKHNVYSNWEARAILDRRVMDTPNTTRGELERLENLRLRQLVWERIPLFARPFGLFIFRYLFQLGCLDGLPGLMYCFLHDFWYSFLVAAKVKEIGLTSIKQSDDSRPIG